MPTQTEQVRPNAARTQVDRTIAKCDNRYARVADPSAAVIFGASGDLAKRKLLPAFYNLAKNRMLPDQFCIVGLARTYLTQEQFQEVVRESVCNKHGSI